MEYSVNAASAKQACLLLPVCKKGLRIRGVTAAQEKVLLLHPLFTDGNFETGKLYLLYDTPVGTRVILVGVESDAFTEATFITAVTELAGFLKQHTMHTVATPIADWPVTGRDTRWKIHQWVLAWAHAEYRFNIFKTKKPAPAFPVRMMVWHTRASDTKLAKAASKEAMAIQEGIAFTKDLGNLPGNVCTPTYIATEAKKLAKQHNLKLEVVDERAMEKLGMHTLLAVSKGSVEPPYLLSLHYEGKKKAQPIVLVGKGITFDTGGISIKPSHNMEDMKFDMSGAGSVLGIMKAVALLGLPINLIGVVATCENFPGPHATRPGDIVKSLAGTTVEILNTDAEGRLILCDALTYCKRFNPAVIMDMATLTGAIVRTLGSVASGIFTHHDALASALEKAGTYTRDRVWRLPMWDEYQEMLNSPFADMANIGGAEAGSITAACFLERFTRDFPAWAHIDIAGVAYKDKRATGRPIPLIMEYLLRYGR